MDIQDIKKRTRASQRQILDEKKSLVQRVIDIQQAGAADLIARRVREALEQLEERVEKAVGRGEISTTVLQVSAHLYDLRTAVLDYLKAQGDGLSQQFPALHRVGPFTYSQVESLIRETGEECTTRQAAPWVRRYQEYLERKAQARGFKKMLARPPALAEPVREFLETCTGRGLKPEMELHRAFEDEGIAVTVSW